MHLGNYLGMVHQAEIELGKAFRQVAGHHGHEPDIFRTCHTLADQCEAHVTRLQPFVDRYGEDAPSEPKRLHSVVFKGLRRGGLGLLRDLQDLYLIASEVDISWTLIRMAAQGLRDKDLLAAVQDCDSETALQLRWLRTRLKQSAPQALIAAD